MSLWSCCQSLVSFKSAVDGHEAAGAAGEQTSINSILGELETIAAAVADAAIPDAMRSEIAAQIEVAVNSAIASICSKIPSPWGGMIQGLTTTTVDAILDRLKAKPATA